MALQSIKNKKLSIIKWMRKKLLTFAILRKGFSYLTGTLFC